MMRIAVCVITFNHLPGLGRLLASIARLCFQKTAPEVAVLIVDNDPKGSARGLVEKMAPAFPFKLLYETESRRGISAARNQAVKASMNADFLAFVDDDEQVDPDWLEQLVVKQMESEADIVMGPVQPKFERPVPDWIVKGGFFIKDPGKYGARDQKYFSTANILIRKACLENQVEPFADEFNLTGGADYLLLLRLKIKGARIDWAPSARVVEHIRPARANGRWILQRRFRIGNTIALAERSLKLPSSLVRPGKGVLRILQGVFLLPLALLRNKAETVRTLGMIFYGCGNLSGFCGCPYQEYDPGKTTMADSAGRSKKRLLYLSGALRVSTHPQAAVGGARAHVLGVISAFKNLHWLVETYVVGDRVSRPWRSRGFDGRQRFSLGQRIAADLIRLFSGFVSRRRLSVKFRQTDWVYERSGLFQNLGSRCKKNGIPWILEANALIAQEAFLDRGAIFFYRLAKKMEIKAYRRCDALVCVSASLKEQIVAVSGIDPRKAVVSANGVDTDLFNPASHPAKRFFKEPTIGFVGTMYPWQGLHLLLNVLAELSEAGVSLKLVLVGDGPELDELRGQAVALGLSDDVHFAGRVEWGDVPAAIAGLDIGFSGQVSTASGAWNGSPIKIYEFMAMKKPVIASAFEDAMHTIDVGRTGYLFQPDDPAALKECITTAFKEKEKWPAMGELARKEIERSCSWTERVRNMILRIEPILEKNE